MRGENFSLGDIEILQVTRLNQVDSISLDSLAEFAQSELAIWQMQVLLDSSINTYVNASRVYFALCTLQVS